MDILTDVVRIHCQIRVSKKSNYLKLLSTILSTV